jgi:dephospho-CoA kinase
VFRTGLTGGIGSGKSVVSRIFRTFGFPVYDADREAKRFLLCDEVTRLFGTAAPKEIAAIVFSDMEKLHALNAIVHPLVMADFEQWALSRTSSFVFIESAIIYEANLQHHFDKIIVVDAPEELRIERVMRRNGCSREDVLQRMSAQITPEEALRRADFIIYNDENASLLKQVQTFLSKFP